MRPPHPPHDEQALEIHLWDLCAHTEAKLRYIKQVQEQIEKFRRLQNAGERHALQQMIVKTLDDIAEITSMMHVIAEEAGAMARTLATWPEGV